MPTGVYPRKITPPGERLWAMIHPVTESGCWLFTGALNKVGYGWFNMGDHRVELAHRAAYALFVCEPGDQCVLHKCDVPSCVNPDHLYLGTQADNMRDAKVRKRVQRGEQRKCAKLTEAVVREIRSSGKRGFELADHYGVTRTTVYDVLNGKSWAHVV